MEEFEKRTAGIFDHMANEYDDIMDLWYSWLFMRIQYFISEDIISEPHINNCLDVGCGTGFQSFLFSELGIDVIGIDISEGLLNQARQKLDNSESGLLSSSFDFINKYKSRTIENVELYNPTHKKGTVDFRYGSAIELPFADESFDSINCIGSVVSFIEDYKKPIREFYRVLKPNGTLFFEFENKYNLDILWPMIDSITPFSLGYDISFKESLSNAFKQTKKHIKVDYPFSMHNEEIDMKIWLFNYSTLKNEFNNVGFSFEKSRSVHSITNLIPSTKSDDSNPSKFKRRIFKTLSRFEHLLCEKFPIYRLGCSTYVKMKKRDITIDMK